MRRLDKDHPIVDFNCKYLSNRIDNFKFKDNFKFTGFRNDIPYLLSGMDIYFQPSLWEGLPLGILEALRAGLPVIGSKAPGLLEALHRECHYLCSEANDVEGHVRYRRNSIYYQCNKNYYLQ
jgi:glycosyltransferase involved in cell wall biosynthesis